MKKCKMVSVFTQPDVNTETILHFFYKITNERGTKTVFTYSHVKWFYGQSERAYYLNYFIINGNYCILCTFNVFSPDSGCSKDGQRHPVDSAAGSVNISPPDSIIYGRDISSNNSYVFFIICLKSRLCGFLRDQTSDTKSLPFECDAYCSPPIMDTYSSCQRKKLQVQFSCQSPFGKDTINLN